jgi:hypothetical protein
MREAFEENQVRVGATAYLGYQEVHRPGRARYAQVRMAGMIEEFAPRAPDPDGGRVYRRLMTSLEAAPGAEIIVVGAYDPDIGAFAFADPLFTQLNQAQQAAAATVRARFADPFPAFNPQGDPAAETTAICTLTLLCSQGDGHPSDAGYRALARIVWAASAYARLR